MRGMQLLKYREKFLYMNTRTNKTETIKSDISERDQFIWIRARLFLSMVAREAPKKLPAVLQDGTIVSGRMKTQ